MLPTRATLPFLPSVTAVVTQFPAPSQTFIHRKLDGLRAAGMDVRVAAARFAEPSSTTGYPYLCLMPWTTPGTAASTASRSAWQAMVRTAPGLLQRRSHLRVQLSTAPILAIDSDVVHFEFSGIAASYLDRLATLADRSFVAVSCRGAAEQIEPLHNPARRSQLAEVFDAASLIHCVSDDMRRTVENYGAPPDRILVNRPAVPVERFADLRGPVRTDGGPLRVLSIGRLHWKKGFDDALRAMAQLRRQGVQITYRIAGDGTERSKLEFMIHAMSLGEQVELLGVCGQDQIRSLLSWADVLLLPSISEGISNAVLEAMAAGLPVVSTRCGGMDEVIEDRRTGLLVGISDTDAMVDRLSELAVDLDLRAELSSNAAAHADAELDISHQVNRFLDAYRRLIS